MPGNLDRLNSVELVPFRGAIAAGVDTVMVGHLIVPAIEPDPNRPASISSRVIKDLLKSSLAFTDWLSPTLWIWPDSRMSLRDRRRTISRAAAIAAVQAGNDMVIIPGDLDAAYNGLLEAVKRGEISDARINASVLKILRMNASVGLNRNRFVDLSDVENDIARPENIAVAQSVADRAVTLVSDPGRLLRSRRSVRRPPPRRASTPRNPRASSRSFFLTGHAAVMAVVLLPANCVCAQPAQQSSSSTRRTPVMFPAT